MPVSSWKVAWRLFWAVPLFLFVALSCACLAAGWGMRTARQAWQDVVG